MSPGELELTTVLKTHSMLDAKKLLDEEKIAKGIRKKLMQKRAIMFAAIFC